MLCLVLLKITYLCKIIFQKNSALHDRCIAMLANYGAVQKEVEAFYSANKELVLKISDYISHWEEKSKLPKDSSKSDKLSPVMKSSKNIQKTNHKNEISPNSNKSKLKAVFETKSDADNNGAALMFHNDGKLTSETEDSNNDVNEKKIVKKTNFKNFIKITEKSKDLSNNENSSAEAEELNKSEQESESDENNEEEINSVNSNNKNENSLEAEKLDSSDQEIESDCNNEEKERNDSSLNINMKDKNSSMEVEELDSDKESESDEDDEEINGNFLHNYNDKEIKDSSGENSNIKTTHKSVSEFDAQLKMNTGAKNKLKAITLLNLNELEGLDEIPVGNSVRNDESAEEESSEEVNETFQNKCSDPFFLGHNKQNSLQNKSTDSFFLGHSKDFNPKELDDSSKDSSDFYNRTKNSTHSFKHKALTAKKSFSDRKDGHFSPKKSFQKSSYNHRNDSKRFKNEEYSAKSFKKDKFSSTNYHSKFQERDFNKNGKDFKQKNMLFPPRVAYDKKQLKNIPR